MELYSFQHQQTVLEIHRLNDHWWLLQLSSKILPAVLCSGLSVYTIDDHSTEFLYIIQSFLLGLLHHDSKHHCFISLPPFIRHPCPNGFKFHSTTLWKILTSHPNHLLNFVIFCNHWNFQTQPTNQTTQFWSCTTVQVSGTSFFQCASPLLEM